MLPSTSLITSGPAEPTYAIAEFVVPKSIPTMACNRVLVNARRGEALLTRGNPKERCDTAHGMVLYILPFGVARRRYWYL